MDMTGSGTNIDSILNLVILLSVTKESPEAQSIPNVAQISPALACKKDFVFPPFKKGSGIKALRSTKC